jgi:rare lipoprotein A
MIGFRFSSAFILTAIAIYPALAESGLAAFYSGGRTASSEVTAQRGLLQRTARYLLAPGCWVTNLRNGKTVVVRIVDRGPYGRGRVIDVSRAAARELDMISAGTTMVSIERQ